MNIGPIQIVPGLTETGLRRRTEPARFAPNSGKGSRADASETRNHVSSALIPEEVVKVHSDDSSEPPILGLWTERANAEPGSGNSAAAAAHGSEPARWREVKPEEKNGNQL